jgi:hypothetical protein
MLDLYKPQVCNVMEHVRSFILIKAPAVSSLRVFAVTGGCYPLSLFVFVLGILPVATNIVRSSS